MCECVSGWGDRFHILFMLSQAIARAACSMMPPNERNNWKESWMHDPVPARVGYVSHCACLGIPKQVRCDQAGSSSYSMRVPNRFYALLSDRAFAPCSHVLCFAVHDVHLQLCARVIAVLAFDSLHRDCATVCASLNCTSSLGAHWFLNSRSSHVRNVCLFCVSACSCECMLAQHTWRSRLRSRSCSFPLSTQSASVSDFGVRWCSRVLGMRVGVRRYHFCINQVCTLKPGKV